MINLTTAGHTVILGAITAAVRGLHLYTDTGELTEHGYAAKALTPEAWDGNKYPTQTWTFTEGEAVRVLGYYTTGANGEVLWSREFPVSENNPDDYTIGRADDRINVTLTFGLLVGNQ